MTGGIGNDSLAGLAGNDTIVGGAGDDTCYIGVASVNCAVTYDQTAQAYLIVSSEGTDTVKEVEFFASPTRRSSPASSIPTRRC